MTERGNISLQVSDFKRGWYGFLKRDTKYNRSDSSNSGWLLSTTGETMLVKYLSSDCLDNN